MSEVEVHIRAGCSLCGSKEKHTHPWPEWEEHVHGKKEEKK